jgi:hypothetical protein
MALEPARLNSDRAAGYGPFGAIRCGWHSSAWEVD